MTEDEAKKKLCPSLVLIAGYKFGAPQKMPYCIASACMMWRWEEQCEQCLNAGLMESGYCGVGGTP